MLTNSPLDNISSLSLRVTVKLDGTVMKHTYRIVSININHCINRISVADIH